MTRGIGGEGGARGGRDPNAGGSSKGGGTGNGGDQRHKNRLAEINRVGTATKQSTKPTGNTGVSPAGRTSSTYQGMGRDYRNTGNTTMDNIGNRIASMIGFNEQRPSLQDAMSRATGTPAGSTIDKRAGWGFDPASAIGTGIGAGFGVPLLGTAFDYMSKLAGRPMEISMGPSVFGGGPSYGSPGSSPSSSPQYGGGSYGGNGGFNPFQSAASTRPKIGQQATPVASSLPRSRTQSSMNFSPQPWQSQNYSPFSPSTNRWSWSQ